MLWFLRDQAERRFWDHVRGESVSGEVWAAVNTPDEAFETPASATYTPPPAEWKTLKDEWEKEAAFLLELKKVAHRTVGESPGRSEEHTSELQSLMRISYAVFCLKKKKIKKDNRSIPRRTIHNNPYESNDRKYIYKHK